MRPRWTAAPMLALLAILTACGARVVDVSVTAGGSTAGPVTLAVGERLRLDLGEVNASVGDAWYLTGEPEAAVLVRGDDEYERDPECAGVGCGGRLAWTFLAQGAGTTTLVLRYCYRSRPAQCEAQPGRGPADPVSLRVTVTP